MICEAKIEIIRFDKAKLQQFDGNHQEKLRNSHFGNGHFATFKTN